MVRIKICGIRTLDEAQAAIASGADALGFHVDLEHSKCPVGAATAASIISRLPPFIASVVVTTVTESKELIRILRATWANTLQLHGDVSPDTIRALKAVLPYLKVYVVVHVRGEETLKEAEKFEEAADAIILDSADQTTGARGGTGKTHDWSMSQTIVSSTSLPVILAGGLNPENVADAIRTVRPYAVDVNSGVSNPDGTKDIEKVKLFVKQAKSVDR
ncbi:MAG: phosphoribosylanthranilate isomerase [bacterium]|nr:phosphoribosylanthranilate isomerase [bacterium]